MVCESFAKKNKSLLRIGVLSTPWPGLLGLVLFDFHSLSFSGEIHASVIVLTVDHLIHM